MSAVKQKQLLLQHLKTCTRFIENQPYLKMVFFFNYLLNMYACLLRTAHISQKKISIGNNSDLSNMQVDVTKLKRSMFALVICSFSF